MQSSYANSTNEIEVVGYHHPQLSSSKSLFVEVENEHFLNFKMGAIRFVSIFLVTVCVFEFSIGITQKDAKKMVEKCKSGFNISEGVVLEYFLI